MCDCFFLEKKMTSSVGGGLPSVKIAVVLPQTSEKSFSMASNVVLLKIRSLMPSFSKKEQKLAEYILNHPQEASRMTITEMSSALDVVDSTVFKFTKKLGYSGFRDFHTNLLAEAYDPEISIHENISSGDSVSTIAEKIFASSANSLNDTLALLDSDTLDQAVEILQNANLISFYGCGESSVVALDAYQKFLRSPINCHYIADAHMQLMHAARLKEGDCAFVISHTGATREMIAVAQIAHEVKAKVIVITSFPSQKLSSYADISFTSISEEVAYRTESLASRYAQLAIIDTLYTALMFRSSGTEESLRRIREAIVPTKVDLTPGLIRPENPIE